MLSDAQIERYSRQIILPQLGGKGQEKFLQSRILVNGSGVRHTITLLYLAAAGVGTIGVIGVRMQTEASLFSALKANFADPALPSGQGSLPEAQTPDVVETLTRLNPDCQIVLHSDGGKSEPHAAVSVEPVVSDYDLVISEPGPLLDVCYASRRPFVCSWGQAAAGRLFVWNGNDTKPCFQCVPSELRERADATSEQIEQIEQIMQGKQILGSMTGIDKCIDTLADLFFGAFQATEALKCLMNLGVGASAYGKVFECQFPDVRWSEHLIQKDPACEQCGQAGGQADGSLA